MRNNMQIKAAIKIIASENNISAQAVLQNYMMERLLERITLTSYFSKFILKGGFLIASMFGLNVRSTMDMDATIRGISVNPESIRNMFEEICSTQIEDDIKFTVKRIVEIRNTFDYTGYRISLDAEIFNLKVPLKVDLTVGDVITPKEIQYDYKLLFESRSIRIFAYNIETLLAEKLETILSRGDQNTRHRDYYDVYVIQMKHLNKLNLDLLRNALFATAKSRHTSHLLKEYKSILSSIERSRSMQKSWSNYQSKFKYASDIKFDEICKAITYMLSLIIT